MFQLSGIYYMSVYEFTLDVRCRAQALNRVTKSKQLVLQAFVTLAPFCLQQCI